MTGWLRLLYGAAIFGAVAFCLLGPVGCNTKEADKKDSAKKEGENKKAEESKITKANFDKVKDNMAEKEVMDILGTPDKNKEIPGGKEYLWENGNNKITIGILEGKVGYKASQFVK